MDENKNLIIRNSTAEFLTSEKTKNAVRNSQKTPPQGDFVYTVLYFNSFTDNFQ